MSGQCRGRKHTPIKSKKQQGAMGLAYAAKKGEISPSGLWEPARKMYKSMSKAELRRNLKESKVKKLPAKVKKRK
jgi:2-methylcitrate dehydratase PrpD